MPYIVNNSDGSLTVTVADNTVDTTTYSLALVGRNVSNYGQYFAQNTIRHLENFADTVAPSPSVRLVGQLWFDKNEQVLRVWDGSAWKRATNNVVNSESQRPTSGLVGGEGFFNLTTKTLQIYNGSDWQNASYPGEITTEYANDANQGSPAFYGTRMRNLLLKESGSSQIHPVLALVYVNSGTNNQGKTQDVEPGQDETIIALFSDVAFIVDSTGSPDNSTYYTELTATGGIAAARSGRSIGQILKGMNVRAEAESSAIATADTLFVTTIGSANARVSTGWFSTLDVSSSINIDGAANVVTLNVDATSSFGGDIDATGQRLTAANIDLSGTANINIVDATTGDFDTLVVNNSTTLNGNTAINGNLTVNGVDTQSLGSSGNVIEEYYGNLITASTIVVESSADITGNLTVTGDTQLASANVTGLLEAQSLNVSGATSFANLSVDTVLGNISGPTGNFTDTLTADTLVVNSSTTLNTDTTINGNLTVNGVNTQNIGTGSQPIENYFGVTATYSGNITAANFNGNHVGNISGTTGSFTGNVSADNFNGDLSGNVSGTTGSFSGNVSANYFVGTATEAQYADLAEIYAADQDYEPGTVVKIGGEAEITATDKYLDVDVFGVISTDPAYLMNSKAQGLPVALQGRVPVRVLGPVKKGERLVSSDLPGTACAFDYSQPYDPRFVIGRALEDKNSEDAGIVEAVIGVK